jgi:hypothetical protein
VNQRVPVVEVKETGYQLNQVPYTNNMEELILNLFQWAESTQFTLGSILLTIAVVWGAVDTRWQVGKGSRLSSAASIERSTSHRDGSVAVKHWLPLSSNEHVHVVLLRCYSLVGNIAMI